MEIGNFEDIDKYYCLILDSMSIKKEVHLEKASNRYSLLFITLYYIGHFETLILLIIWCVRYVGYFDYGNNLTIEDYEIPASEVLVFMLSSLKKAWK